MATPLTPYANLTLVFETPNDPLAVTSLDPHLEASTTPTIATTKQVAIVYAKRQKINIRPFSDSDQDAEMSRVHYKGYWSSPQFAFRGLQAEQAAPAIVWRVDNLSVPAFRLPDDAWTSIADYEQYQVDNSDRILLRGNFILAPTPANQFGVPAFIGDPMAGYLLVQASWLDSL